MEKHLEQNSPVNVSTQVKQSFVKLCFTVPDIAATVKHLKSQGAKFLLELEDRDTEGVCCKFLGCDHPDNGKDRMLWDAAEGVAFVEDPNGYLIEIVAMDPTVVVVK